MTGRQQETVLCQNRPSSHESMAKAYGNPANPDRVDG